jgi:hypothetical protein
MEKNLKNCREISIDQPGNSSAHLKGQFSAAIRKDGTGFLTEFEMDHRIIYISL